MSPVIGAGGMVVGSSTILRDLTSRDARDQRIHELEAEVTRLQRLVEVGPIVFALVHEVSEPLTAINNYVHVCRRLAANTGQESISTALERIAEQSDRAREVILRLRELVQSDDRKTGP